MIKGNKLKEGWIEVIRPINRQQTLKKIGLNRIDENKDELRRRVEETGSGKGNLNSEECMIEFDEKNKQAHRKDGSNWIEKRKHGLRRRIGQIGLQTDTNLYEDYQIGSGKKL